MPFKCVDTIPYDNTDKNVLMSSLIKSYKDDMIGLVMAKQLFATNITFDVILFLCLMSENCENITTLSMKKKKRHHESYHFFK